MSEGKKGELEKISEALERYDAMGGNEGGRSNKRSGIGVKDAIFCGLVLKHTKPEDAYKIAYGDSGKTDRYYRMLAKAKMENRHIAEFINGVREEWKRYRLLDAMGKRQVLHDMVMDEQLAARDRINAIKVDNDMVGDVAVKKVEVEHRSSQMESLLEKIRKDRGYVPVSVKSPDETLRERIEEVFDVEVSG